MKVTSPADFSHVTPLGRPVEKGETVEVDDALGAQLIAQGWTSGAKAKGRRSSSTAESASEITEPAPSGADQE